MRYISIFLLAALSAGELSAAVDCNSCHGRDPSLSALPAGEASKALRRVRANADNAIGVMDRGQLGNFGSNLGDMADFHIWNNNSLHWPAEASDVFQYAFGFGLVVAQRDSDGTANVIESVINATSGLRDWTPAEGSLGTLFSGELRASDETPYLAHSHLPQTWPDSGWPGAWREEYAFPNPSGNPAFPVQDAPGEFTSDGDTWAVFDDRENPRGSLGIEVRQAGFSYGRPYASDHLVWRSWIHNTSGADLDSVYIGYYVNYRPDYDFVDRIGMTGTAELGLPHGRERDIVRVWDANNELDGVWAEEDMPLGVPAFVMLETPQDLGVTDFHYFRGELKPDTDELFWNILASRPEQMDEVRRAVYFHGENPRIDDTDLALQEQLYGEGARINFVVMSGPLTIAAGDSVLSSCAAVIGESGDAPGEPSFDDLDANIADLWNSYTRYRFGGPPPPPAPDLRGAAVEGAVRLWWNPLPSEEAEDFQGYRLYRSQDYGLSWGEVITDNRGAPVGYVPLAQWDLEDGITGRDPLGWLWLGEDSGLAYSFEDQDVIPGVEYWYCLKAYNSGQPPTAEEEGLPSQENPFGNPDDRHVIALRPHSLPPGFSGGSAGVDTLAPLDGLLCDGIAGFEVLDPQALRDTEWELSFPADTLGTFHLVDLGAGDTLFAWQAIPDSASPTLPATAGFRLWLEDAAEGVRQLGWNEDSPTTFDWWMEWRSGLVNEFPEYVVGYDDFRVRITESDQTHPLEGHLYFFGLTGPDSLVVDVPIRVEKRAPDAEDWIDVSSFANYEELRLFHDVPGLSDWGWDLIPGGDAGSPTRLGYEAYTDALFLKDNPDPDTGNQILVKTNNFDWHLTAEGDTVIGVAPNPGDVFTVLTNKPFRPGVRYRFRTQPPSHDASRPAAAVRTVPDPYIAGNALEQGENSRRLLFTRLPGPCTIRIYTVAGDLVRVLSHEDPASDQLAWDLRNESRQHVAYGLYLFHVRETNGREQQGRFLVIR